MLSGLVRGRAAVDAEEVARRFPELGLHLHQARERRDTGALTNMVEKFVIYLGEFSVSLWPGPMPVVVVQ